MIKVYGFLEHIFLFQNQYLTDEQLIRAYEVCKDPNNDARKKGKVMSDQITTQMADAQAAVAVLPEGEVIAIQTSEDIGDETTTEPVI